VDYAHKATKLGLDITRRPGGSKASFALWTSRGAGRRGKIAAAAAGRLSSAAGEMVQFRFRASAHSPRNTTRMPTRAYQRHENPRLRRMIG